LGAIEGRGIKTAEKMIKKELFDEGIIVKKERMAKIRLVRLRLKNFKGVKSFELNLDGGNMAVFGDNATGKTTLKDAFLWLLFDKDSQNRADFEIKTIDPKTGEAINGLDHEVEGTLEIDGKELTLRKSYYEKWTRKRGAAEKVFTGHSTDHTIDKVPVKKSEYEERVAQIAGDENTFRLLTDPGYFNEVLHWQERRKILLKVCGDISDSDVIHSNENLASLEDILSERSLADHRKILDARRKEINKELERIPVRIDEVTQGLPDVSEIKADNSEMTALKERKQAKEQELARLEAGGEIAEKTKKLREIESALLDIEVKQRKKNEQATAKTRASLRELEDKISEVSSAITTKQHSFDLNMKFIEDSQSALSVLREKWHEVDDSKFEFEQAEVCPTCGQKLPKEQLEKAREKALADFNQDKASELESITSSGKERREELSQLQKSNMATQQKIEALQKEEATLQQRADAFQKQIDSTEQKFIDPTANPEYTRKFKEKEEVASAIALLRGDNEEISLKVKKEIESLEDDIGLSERHLSQVEVHKNGQARIEELKAQEKDLAAEFEKLEQQIYLSEQFIRTKVDMLQAKINSKFRMARFKLFNVLVNGGLEETAETTYKGIPYSSALNKGAKINVGLDIIRTLSEHYGFEPPILVDGAEAFTHLLRLKSQMITLHVSEKDKSLRVEKYDNQEKEITQNE